MRNYLDLMEAIIDSGEERKDRTGVGTKMLFGTTLRFDLALGFPAVTTKRLAFKQVAAELAGFLIGTTYLDGFHRFGCTIWDANASAPYWMNNPKRRLVQGDLGRIYGAQWRAWRNPNGPPIDQLKEAMNRLIKNPADRRAVVTAWNPAELDEVCLPACHTMFQLSLGVCGLSCFVNMRSVDTFLGMPFDIASYALLTHLCAQDMGTTPGKLVFAFGDTHVYKNHFEQAVTQIFREPKALPRLVLDPSATVDNFHPNQAWLENYDPHPAITASMAV
jgi:thymidylate synthase